MTASLVLFGVDVIKAMASINWTLVLYVIVSLIAVFLGSSKLNNQGIGAAVIFAIGSIAVFVFFGFRWFSNPSSATKQWPPKINTCPDYLTYIPPAAGASGNGSCLDFLGVSSNGELKKATAKSDVTNTSKNFQYTSKDVMATGVTNETLQSICNRCNAAGLTWEGVYDGDTCVAINVVSAASAAQSACLAKVST